VEKKQPKLSQKAGEKPVKSSWNCRNPQNSSPNQAKKPEKSREKVAETAEIPKTAPELSQKSPKKLPNPAQKVAEITINFKTVKKIRLLLKRIEIH
jgi:hypothetical protein